MLAGYTSAGRKVRAWCTCGWQSTPRVDERRALDALESEHGFSDSVCARCGRDRGHDLVLTWRERYTHLQLLVDGEPHADVLAAVRASYATDEAWSVWRERDQVLVCADDLETCRALATQRQADVDEPPPRPTLRVVR